uniref:Uncharacterized protein n=1 Tax=Acanthochromis polyacanthus TaxID=80966 RepID=A0A3Q1GLM9_9TELE
MWCHCFRFLVLQKIMSLGGFWVVIKSSNNRLAKFFFFNTRYQCVLHSRCFYVQHTCCRRTFVSEESDRSVCIMNCILQMYIFSCFLVQSSMK